MANQANPGLEASAAGKGGAAPRPMGWRELYLKEDWWAIYLGIGLMVITLVSFWMGSDAVKSLFINPGGVKWTTLGQLLGHFQQSEGDALNFGCITDAGERMQR